MTDKYILDEREEPIPCDDLLAWARWFEKADRRVAQTEVGEQAKVSTVFLGLDHRFNESEGDAPVLWETMVFGGPMDQEQERYATRDEALAGHVRMAGRVRAAMEVRP